MNRNLRRPQQPMARAVVLKGPHETNWDYGNTELLRDTESTILKLSHMPVPRAFGFRKNNQAGAAVDGALRKAPHALQIRRTPYIRDGNVSETLHQPAVRGNLEVRFQLPSADKLRDRALQHERIEKIHVIRHEERRPVGIKPGSAANFYSRAGEKCDTAAKGALQPIVFVGVKKNPQEHQQGRNDEKM